MPPAFFAVDPHGGVPIYQQLAEQIKRAIAVGALVPGERLPTVKALALELKVNPNTVARVYRDLERDGTIATAPGRGSFIRDPGPLAEMRPATSVALRLFEDAAREARALGIAPEEVRALVDAAITRWYPQEENT